MTEEQLNKLRQKYYGESLEAATARVNACWEQQHSWQGSGMAADVWFKDKCTVWEASLPFPRPDSLPVDSLNSPKPLPVLAHAEATEPTALIAQLRPW